ncbi:MAG: lysine--tRNA ligase [Candidatus Altiarchaeota archaeon]
MHWADEFAEKLISKGKTHVIATGTSISGIPHVGNASDVIRGDAVRKALDEKGADVTLIWIADDSDPFRKVPKGFESLKEYLGFPVHDIPDPLDCHSSFVEHFVSPFLDDLHSFGVTPGNFSGTQMYRKQELLSEVRIALEKRKEIAEILNKFRTTPLPANFIPWNPICEKCKKISTTRPTKVEIDIVSYVCEDTDVAGGGVQGCGHEGASDIKKGLGKMPWRVEWAARWHRFKVTCEPFGKEHATAGGSYDGSKLISEKIFDWPAPMPVIYEFFTLNGAKISSSAGNVVTLSDWLKIAEPEVLKYFMYKRLQKQRDIVLGKISNLTDEYDEAEQVFFDLIEGEEKLKRHYLLSQVGKPKKLLVPFTLCAVLAQLIPDLKIEKIKKRLSRSGYDGFDEDRLVKRLTLAKNWLNQHGPDYLKFTLIDDQEAEKRRGELDDLQRKGLALLIPELGKDLKAKDLHKQIYETARSLDLAPPMLFSAIYQVLIGMDRGPKAAMFLLSLELEFLEKRFSD